MKDKPLKLVRGVRGLSRRQSVCDVKWLVWKMKTLNGVRSIRNRCMHTVEGGGVVVRQSGGNK